MEDGQFPENVTAEKLWIKLVRNSWWLPTISIWYTVQCLWVGSCKVMLW